MHEMSLAEGVLQINEDQAAKSGFARVKTVWLEIGALSGVETTPARAAAATSCRCRAARRCG